LMKVHVFGIHFVNFYTKIYVGKLYARDSMMERR
jgi:hypothetical protein